MHGGLGLQPVVSNSEEEPDGASGLPGKSGCSGGTIVEASRDGVIVVEVCEYKDGDTVVGEDKAGFKDLVGVALEAMILGKAVETEEAGIDCCGLSETGEVVGLQCGQSSERVSVAV